ncbi:MAG: shikimate kinase [Thermodesulfobacteriota bacterium]|nr:shikimate kinase [Thermodesulfobacteriota bacterium]
MNIFLIGYRCTGKTSVGKSLAWTLGWSFIDADLELVDKYGMTITEIVSKEGWSSFREKEKAVVKRLSVLDKHVVATGGGVILDIENVEQMKKSGTIIWLKAMPETIKERILQDQNTEELRPSLTSKGLVEEIEETLLDRKPLYESAMDFSVDTDNRSIEDICGRIIGKLKF